MFNLHVDDKIFFLIVFFFYYLYFLQKSNLKISFSNLFKTLNILKTIIQIYKKDIKVNYNF